MPENLISVDEYMSKRQPFVKGNAVMKAFKSPSSWDDNTGSARFTMSTEEPDRDRDIINQAGLNIDEFLKNPVAPAFHRSRDFPIGAWSDVSKVLNGRPKRTEGTLTLLDGDPDADRMAKHIKAGTIRCCSIGFIPVKMRRREEDGDDMWPGYDVLESTLVECSVVPIPSNISAIAKDAGGDFVAARLMIEEVLDTWAKHPETGLLIPRTEYESALKAMKPSHTMVLFKESAVEKYSEAISEAILTVTEAIEAEKPKAEDAETPVTKSWLQSFLKLCRPAPVEPEPPKPAAVEAKEAAAARSKALRERLAAAGRL